MPRYARSTPPGSVQHIIARVLHGEFRLDAPSARDEFLMRLGRHVAETDWVCIAYAVMSNHVHLVLLAGESAPAAFMRPLQAGFARWLNVVQGRNGYVFQARFRSVTGEGETALAFVSYVHNNPVRARIVASARESRWTSHRAYLGLEEPPCWLDVALGLQLCGVSATKSGRAAFDKAVVDRSTEPRSSILTGAGIAQERRAARAHARSPLEVEQPIVWLADRELRSEVPIASRQKWTQRCVWRGASSDYLHRVSGWTGVSSDELRSVSRSRDVTRARQIAIVAWSRELNRPTIELARALGVTTQGACNAIRRANDDVRDEARRFAKSLAAQK